MTLEFCKRLSIFYVSEEIIMAKKKHFNYKDPNIIYSIFNHSRTAYEAYCELVDGNLQYAQEQLNTAGTKLYQAYELALKCYLDKKYKNLYEEKILSWKKYDQLRRCIESGKQSNGSMVDVRYLYDQMCKYATPHPTVSKINFEIIKNNAKSVNNQNKHLGNDIDEEKYKESFSEIRKFIIVYLDPNPPIQIMESPQYSSLQEACDYWKNDSRFNYCLISDKNVTEIDVLQRIMYIDWSLVFDFDSDSEINGLAKAYSIEHHQQANRFNPENPIITEINSISEIPYWFYAGGLSDLPNSLVSNERQWRQKYGSKLTDCLKKYHASYSKPLKVIILGGPAKRVKDIVDALDSVYDENGIELYLLSAEVQYEDIREEYEDIMNYYPLSVEEFSSGINNYASLFNKEDEISDYQIVSKDGYTDIKPSDYSLYELLYYGIADRENINEDDVRPDAFYQGKCPLSWYGVKHEFAINRVVQYRDLKKKIQNATSDTTSKVIELRHEPGAGGTTLARMIAYELSKEMPVVILNAYNDKLSYQQLQNLYRKVRMSILIVVESSLISNEELSKLIEELMAHAVPHVILHVNRLRSKTKKTDKDVLSLTDFEFNEMYQKLEVYMDDDKKEIVKKLSLNPVDRYPFFVSLYTFEEEFCGVSNYIQHFITNISQNDREVLEYISLVDKFANRLLDVNFFQIVDKTDPMGVFADPTNKSLITLVRKGKNDYLKIRHIKFADEILGNRIGVNAGASEYQKALNMSNLLREFIKFSKHQIMFDLDSTIDILKNLLILRDANSLIKDRFAPVISYIIEMLPEDRSGDKYNVIGVVFKDLVDTYPEEAHFKAHLSRYYTHIEGNYQRGIEEAKGAIELSESQGLQDALLYHIAGMSIRKYVEKKLFQQVIDLKAFGENEEADNVINEIQKMLKEASKYFEKVRDTNNKVAGYISDVEMCIELIDFEKKFIGCSTEVLLRDYKDSWFMEYYDRALTLLEGFKSLQVEEETEFNKIRLSVKSSESLQDMMNNIEMTVSMWEKYLSQADELRKPVVRRFIARAKQNQIQDETSRDAKTVEYVMKLMEDNIKQEPDNGSNIRIWFNALRFCENRNPEILLDDAIEKLGVWKRLGNNYEAYYYFFILMCIKAIEGGSRAEALIPSLQEELKIKTSHMPNNRVIYEWLGPGKGVNRLINSYYRVNGIDRKRSIEEIEDKAEYIGGRISKYSSDRSAQIRSHNMEVFYSPSMQIEQTTQEDIGKQVQFILGFSYDGLRALNRSVKLVENDQDTVDELFIGKMVRCQVIGLDRSQNYLKMKFMDYQNQMGSIFRTEVEDGDNIQNYENKQIIWARIIDKRYNSNDQRYYWQLSLKREESVMDEWQKKLHSIKL